MADMKNPPRTNGEVSTASELERLSVAIVEVLNDKDFAFTSALAQELEAHISPEWRGQFDTQQGHVTWEEQKLLWKERAEMLPDIVWIVVEVSADVNKRTGTANVHLEMEMLGMGQSKFLAFNENKWVRVNGRWLCHRTVGMRGSPGNNGLP